MLLKTCYEPAEYFKEVMSNTNPCHRIEEVWIGSTFGATIPAQVGSIKCNALVDTGATRSCISREFYEMIMKPPLRTIQKAHVISATGAISRALTALTKKMLSSNGQNNVKSLLNYSKKL